MDNQNRNNNCEPRNTDDVGGQPASNCSAEVVPEYITRMVDAREAGQVMMPARRCGKTTAMRIANAKPAIPLNEQHANVANADSVGGQPASAGSAREYRANFLWPHDDGSVEEAGYEFANARTEDYRRKWWNILRSRIEAQNTMLTCAKERSD